MIRLKVAELLEENGKTRYWLVKQMDSNYTTITRLTDNLISGIKYETIEKLMAIFNLQSLDQLIEYKRQG